jgi:hypothetical protein
LTARTQPFNAGAMALLFAIAGKQGTLRLKFIFAVGRNFAAANSGSMLDGPNEFQPPAKALYDHLRQKVE